MSVYLISLFLHIAGALGLAAVLALEWASVYGFRRATALGQAREWARLLAAPRIVGGPASLIVLVTGIHLTATRWGPQGWIIVGRALEQAVAGGHDVTAAVRNPKNVSRPARVVPVDLAAPDPLALQAAVRGADAVISGLGARSASDIGIAWRGTQSIIEAMRAEGVRRLVVVSAAPIGAVPTPAHPYPPKYDPGDGFFMRHLFGPFARAAFRTRYADLAHMEELVRESGLDWTIVRPPRLTDKRLSGRYRTAS